MILEDLAQLATPLDRLRLLPGNPRTGDVDALARSLETFGQRKPIVARRDGTVIAGNHTLQAAQSLGWTDIAVVWVDDDDTTANAYALADNRTAELGGYDEQALAALIASVHDADTEMLLATGWSDEAVADLMERLVDDASGTRVADPDAIPESAPAKTMPGDVWILGNHRLMCGDATSPTDLDRLLDGVKADMVWTDPPYGVSYVGKTDEALTIRNDEIDDLDSLLDGAFANLLAGSKKGAAVYVAAPSGPNGNAFAVKLLDLGVFRQRLVWVKDALVLGHSDYHYRHEDIYFGYTPGAKGRRGRGGVGWFGDNSQTTVLEFPKPSRNGEHPTMKPVDLISYCIGNSTKKGQVVLDLFGGSGSTLIAAQVSGRRAFLMELDPRYCDVICRRFQEATGVMPVAESTGNKHDFCQDDE